MTAQHDGAARYTARHPAHPPAGEQHGQTQSHAESATSQRDAYRKTRATGSATEAAERRRLQAKARVGALSDADAKQLRRFAAADLDRAERLADGRQL
jgi:hypothetical protein